MTGIRHDTPPQDELTILELRHWLAIQRREICGLCGRVWHAGPCHGREACPTCNRMDSPYCSDSYHADPLHYDIDVALIERLSELL